MGKGGVWKGGWPVRHCHGSGTRTEMLQGPSKEQKVRRHLLKAGKDPSGKVGMTCGRQHRGTTDDALPGCRSGPQCSDQGVRLGGTGRDAVVAAFLRPDTTHPLLVDCSPVTSTIFML